MEAIHREHLLKRLNALGVEELEVLQSERTQNGHWSFVLREACWLAEDFQRERSKHLKDAKRILKLYETYERQQKSRESKLRKEISLNLRKISGKISRDIKKYWMKIEKLVIFKRNQDLEKERQKSMNLHLEALIEQTEKYTEGVQNRLKLTLHSQTAINDLLEVNSDEKLEDIEDQASSEHLNETYSVGDEVPGEDDSSYDEGSEDDMDEDNESTLEEEEEFERTEKLKQGRAVNYDDEIDLLRKEGEMSLEELKAMYGYGDKTVSEKLEEIEDHASDEVVIQPDHVKANKISFLLCKTLLLRPYQEVGVRWLISLHDLSINGILADEMGLGKTVQTISLLAFLASNRGCWGPHLIVAPSSCIINWEYEIKRFCPGFKVLSYFGSAKQRKILRSGWSKLNAFHICITSYQLIVQDSNVFRRKKWYYLILDEAHNIKNFKSKRWQTLLKFNSLRRLMLSGTPLQNNLLELWSLLHFLMPKLFSSRKEFTFWFNNPLCSSIETNSFISADLVGKLHSIIRPFILRRLKKDVAKQLPPKHERIIFCKMAKRQALLYEDFMSRSSVHSSISSGNYLGMMNALMQLRKICNHPELVEPRPVVTPFIFPVLDVSLPKLLRNSSFQLGSSQLTVWVDDASIFPITSPSNSFISKKLCDSSTLLCQFDEMLQNYGNDRLLRVDEILRQRLIQRSNSISSYFPRILNLPDKVCSYEGVWEEYYNNLNMNYIFPVRRVIVQPLEVRLEIDSVFLKAQSAAVSNIFTVIRQNQLLYYPTKSLVQSDCGKLQSLDTLLRRLKRGQHKCLIFTQMTKMLDILEKFLNLHGYSYLRLDGSTSIEQRQLHMDRFNSDDRIFCFILSTRSGGLGINLVGADTVIFYDTDWNPTVDAQAQDRAHRIGQSREVYIYRLISESTVEENILLKAQQKRKLDSVVISEGKFSTESLFSSRTLQSAFGFTGLEFDGSTNLEQYMKDFEDEEDQKAMSTLRLELEAERQEFDDSDKKDLSTIDSSRDFDVLTSSLKRIDQFAFRVYYLAKSLDLISHFEASEEESVVSDGSNVGAYNDEMIVGNITDDIASSCAWYLCERANGRRMRILRSLKGDCWRKLSIEGVWYWFNEDTGEVSFETPKIILDREELENALARKFNSLPYIVLRAIYSFLCSFPDRMNASVCCARWRDALRESNLSLYVKGADTLEDKKHSRIFPSLRLALEAAHAGDTIIVSRGHHWESLPEITIPLRILREDDNASTPTVIELLSPLVIRNSSVVIVGLDLRTQSCSVAMETNGAKLLLTECNFSCGGESLIAKRSTVSIYKCVFNGGNNIIQGERDSLLVSSSQFLNVKGNTIQANSSSLIIEDSSFNACQKAVFAVDNCIIKVRHSLFAQISSLGLHRKRNEFDLNSCVIPFKSLF